MENIRQAPYKRMQDPVSMLHCRTQEEVLYHFLFYFLQIYIERSQVIGLRIKYTGKEIDTNSVINEKIVPSLSFLMLKI